MSQTMQGGSSAGSVPHSPARKKQNRSIQQKQNIGCLIDTRLHQSRRPALFLEQNQAVANQDYDYAAQKKVSADLAHLSEPDESLSPMKQNYNKDGTKNDPQSFWGDNMQNNQSQYFVESQRMSGTTVIQEMDQVLLQKMSAPIVNPTQIQVNQMKQPSSRISQQNQSVTASKQSQRVELPTANVRVQIQAYTEKNGELEQEQQEGEDEQRHQIRHAQRNHNRFRTQKVTSAQKSSSISNNQKVAPSASTRIQVSSANYGNIQPKHQSQHTNNRANNQSSAQESIISNWGAVQKATSVNHHTNSSEGGQKRFSSGGINAGGKSGAFPIIPRASQQTTGDAPQDLEQFLHRSSIGFQNIMDSQQQQQQQQSTGFNQTFHVAAVTNLNKQGSIVAIGGGNKNSSISPMGRQHQQTNGKMSQQFGYLPSRVDIGIRGVMPFDGQLLRQKASPLAMQGRTLSIIEAHQRRGKSELGLMKTTQVGGESGGHDSSLNDYKTQQSVLKTNHPGTLLKNVNPKIAPKNKESEFARKKVQNLLQKPGVGVSQQDIEQHSPLAFQASLSTQIINNSPVKSVTTPIGQVQSSLQEMGQELNHDIRTIALQKQMTTPFQKNREEFVKKSPRDLSSLTGNETKRKKFNKQQQFVNSKHDIAGVSKPTLVPRMKTKLVSQEQQVTMSADLRNLDTADDPQPLQGINNFDMEDEDGLHEDSVNNIGLMTSKISQKSAIKLVVVQNTNPGTTSTTLQSNNLNTDTQKLLYKNESSMVGGPNETSADSRNLYQQSKQQFSINDIGPNTLQQSSEVTKINVNSAQIVNVDGAAIQNLHQYVIKGTNATSSQKSYQDQMLNLLQVIKNQNKDELSSSKEVDLDNGPQKCLCDENSCNNDGEEADKSGEHSQQTRGQKRHKSIGLRTVKSKQKETPVTTVNTSNIEADYEQLSAWNYQLSKTQTDKVQSPFKRLQPPPPQIVAMDTKKQTNSTAMTSLNPEQAKIKEIAREVLQNQNMQIQNLGHQYLQQLQGNKHKHTLTNLITPKERTGTHTQFQSMQASSKNRQIQKKDFKDPLLNMITSMYTVSNVVNTKTSMYGFQVNKQSCGLPFKSSSLSHANSTSQHRPNILQGQPEDSNQLREVSDYHPHQQSEQFQINNYASSAFKTSKAPQNPSNLISQKETGHMMSIDKNMKNHKFKARRLTQMQPMRTTNSCSPPMNFDSLNKTSSVILVTKQVDSSMGLTGANTLQHFKNQQRDGEIADPLRPEFHSLSSEQYSPSNMQKNYDTLNNTKKNFDTLNNTMNSIKANIQIKDEHHRVQKSLQNEINGDIDAIQNFRLLDSEIGQRDLSKNQPIDNDAIVEQARLIKTGSRSPQADQNKEMINSGASVVMSRIVKGPSQTQNTFESDSIGARTNTMVGKEDIIKEQEDSLEKVEQSLLTQRSLGSNRSKASKASQLQVIVLELPNVHANEDQVSPQRIQILSREGIPVLTPLQTDGSRTRKNRDTKIIRSGRASSFDNQGIQINDQQSFENLNEAQILLEMEATIRESSRKSKNNKNQQDNTWKNKLVKNRGGFNKQLQLQQNQTMRNNSTKQNKTQSDSLNSSTYVIHQHQQAAEAATRMTLPVIARDQNNQQRQDHHHSINIPKPQFEDLLIDIRRPGQSTLQYIKDLRALADHISKKQNVPFEESFTFVSGTAKIHQDNPKLFKRQYFSNLRQQEQQLMENYNQARDVKQKEVQRTLKQRKSNGIGMRNRQGRAKTQMLTRKQDDEHRIDGAQVIDYTQKGQYNPVATVKQITKKNSTIQIAPDLMIGNRKAEMGDTSATRAAERKSDENIQILCEEDDDYQEFNSPTPPRAEYKLLTDSSDKDKQNSNLPYDRMLLKQSAQFAISHEKQNQSRASIPINNNKKAAAPAQFGHNAKSDMTCTTITLPEKTTTPQLNDKTMEQQMYDDLKKSLQKGSTLLPSPRLGAALEQIEAERQQNQQQFSAHVLLSNKRQQSAELGFVQIKQSQLENLELAEMGRLQNNRESVNEGRGFKSSIKKISLKEANQAYNNTATSLSGKPTVPYRFNNGNVRKASGFKQTGSPKKSPIKNEIQHALDLQGHKLELKDQRSPSEIMGRVASQQIFAQILREGLQENNNKVTTKVKGKIVIGKHDETSQTVGIMKPWSKGAKFSDEIIDAEASEIIKQLYSSEGESNQELMKEQITPLQPMGTGNKPFKDAACQGPDEYDVSLKSDGHISQKSSNEKLNQLKSQRKNSTEANNINNESKLSFPTQVINLYDQMN